MPNDEPYEFFQRSKRVVGGIYIDYLNWPTFDEAALEGEVRNTYLKRKIAVTMYLSGEPLELIKEKSSFTSKQAYRLIRERCIEIHEDGRVYGWRGLIPYLHINPYTRRTKIVSNSSGHGNSGALTALFNSNPQLKIEFDNRIRRGAKSSNKLQEIKYSKRRHTAWLLDKLRGLGYEARSEWPFDTVSRAYYSIRKYIDALITSDPILLASESGGTDFIKKLKTGDASNRPIAKFMQRVEMDAHKLDGLFCVSIQNIDGRFEDKMVHRLWVIVLIEVVSRAVLGYYFSLRKEVSKEDVMLAIKSSLKRWVPPQVVFCKEPYTVNAGMPSTVDENLIGLCWDETSVDGALAETCHEVKKLLLDVVGSTLLEPKNSFSVRRSKDDRPFIESFFRNIAGGGLQRLSNTTGANIKIRKGLDPEKAALASRFQYEYAEELLAVLIANYNDNPHSGIGYRTPNSYASLLYRESNIKFRKVDQELIDSYFSFRKKCVVRGGAKMGRSPYIEFYYARYTNEILHNRHDLVGSEIWVICHMEEDARVVKASTLNGNSLGLLRASPPWNGLPHSISVRASIRRASLNGYFSLSNENDAISAFIEFVENQPRKRLPIHPAYMEVRRIIANAGDDKKDDSTKILNYVNKTKSVKTNTLVLNDEKRSEDVMPPRRMTKSK